MLFINTAFVIWARNEVGKFGNNFRKHVFTSESTLTIVAECVALVRSHSEQVCIRLYQI